MHAISSYRGNIPTHTPTNKQTGPITIHCAAASAQCNNHVNINNLTEVSCTVSGPVEPLAVLPADPASTSDAGMMTAVAVYPDAGVATGCDAVSIAGNVFSTTVPLSGRRCANLHFEELNSERKEF